MSSTEAPNLLDQFSTALVRDHVDIIEFVESDKYLNRRLYPRQRTLLKIIFLQDLDDYDKKVVEEWESGYQFESDQWVLNAEAGISPKLFERMDYLKKNNFPHFSVVQLIGGRGSSKGFITAAAATYKLWQLVQLENPQREFGMEESKDIFFNIIANSQEQAKKFQYADITDALIALKPLNDRKLLSNIIAESASVNTPFDLRKKGALRAQGIKIDRDLASLIFAAHGTNSQTIRGSRSIMCIFDEMAHFLSGESRLSDKEIWKAATAGMDTYGQYAMIFANSSPWSKTGMFYTLWEQAVELDPQPDGAPLYPGHLMLQFPSWELYKDWTPKSKAPPPQVDPPEINPMLAREEVADPIAFKVERRGHFAEVIDAFLDPTVVDRIFSPQNQEAVIGRALRPMTGAVGFVRYKGHGDPSAVTDNFGIAVGHVEEIKDTETGLTISHVVFDYIDAFYPEDFPNGTIDWLKVVPIITQLINGFRPFEWTFDQFDSPMAIQVLEEKLRQLGIAETSVHVKHATAKLNERRAKNFRQAANLNRIHAPHPSHIPDSSTRNSLDLVRNELKYLQEKRMGDTVRVDHQTTGPIKTKDIADCMFEVVDALIGDSILGVYANLDAGMELGAQGGYSIGGIGQGNTDMFPELTQWFTRTGRDHPDRPSSSQRISRPEWGRGGRQR